MTSGRSELGLRALTGALYVGLTIGAALAGPWTTLLLFLPVCLIAAREWHRLARPADREGGGGMATTILATVSFISFGVIPMLRDWNWAAATGVVLALFVCAAFMMLRSGAREPAGTLGEYLVAVVYIAMPFALVTHLVSIHWHVFTGSMILLWSSDTGAYLVGRAVGRTKLMPSVSPGKTWEGLLGGLLLTLLVGWLIARYWTELTPTIWMVSALAVSITSTIGDLLESAFKRARGVKDSGRVLPGHGGILDRFDGYLLAAPAMMIVLNVLA